MMRLLLIFIAGFGLWLALDLALNRAHAGRALAFATQGEDHHNGLGEFTDTQRPCWPRFGFNNPIRILATALTQWSVEIADINAWRWEAYALATALAILGFVAAPKRFALWTAALLAGLVLFFALLPLAFFPRYFQRAIPFVCILDAAGLAALWRRANLPGRFALLVIAPALAVAVSLDPCRPAAATRPVTAPIAHLRDVITEPDALVVSGWDNLRTSFALRTQTILPFVPATDPNWVIDGHKLQPLNAANNPEVIATALADGRKVWLAIPGLSSSNEVATLNHLHAWFIVTAIEQGKDFASPSIFTITARPQ